MGTLSSSGFEGVALRLRWSLRRNALRWVVFTTLDFDNYLCNFILFIFDCEHAFTWQARGLEAEGNKSKFPQSSAAGQAPAPVGATPGRRTPEAPPRADRAFVLSRRLCRTWLLIYWAPVGVALACATRIRAMSELPESCWQFHRVQGCERYSGSA